MAEIRIPGCRPEPLSSYLKALGLIRLLAAQVSPSITSRWVGDELSVETDLSVDQLVSFLVDEYAPTPLLAPWNKGSGFGVDDPTKSPTAFAAVQSIAESQADRFAEYRRSIQIARQLAATDGWLELTKEEQVSRCRSALPDAAVDWLDASVVLANDRLAFPPILGTGGNDGRFDFASNFMARLAELSGMTKRGRRSASSADLARAALMGDGVRLDPAAIGQFNPSAAGGPSSSPFGSAESLANPWEFVLALEGALLFGSAAARRLGSAVGVPSTPFMVQSSSAGYATSASEKSRGELWTPLWRHPTSFVELARVFTEGRAEYRGRQARSGLDMHRAMATLGVDRGLQQFGRYGFIERNGLATFAVPLGRIRVIEVAGAELFGQLDGWIGRLRRAPHLPASAAARVRRVDESQISFTRLDGRSEGDRQSRAVIVQGLLAELAALHRLAECSAAVADAAGSPLRGLHAADWLPLADDGSTEHQLAASIASLRPRGFGTGLVRGLVADHEFSGSPPAVMGFGARPVHEVLADCLARLALETRRSGRAAHQNGSFGDVFATSVGLAAVQHFLDGATDDRRLAELIHAYLLLDWRRPLAPASSHNEMNRMPTHPLFALVKPFFHHRPLQARSADGSFLPSPDWPRLLLADRGDDVAQHALRRLRINGLPPRLRSARRVASGGSARRIAAACLFPLSDRSVDRLLRQSAVVPQTVLVSPAKEEAPA